MDTLLQRAKRFISWHRRIIAALLVGVATAIVLGQLRPDTVDLTDVAVLTSNLEQGHRLTASDVHLVRAPRDTLPDEYLDTAEEAIGRTISVSLSPGTVLQHGLLSAAPTVAEGRSLTPIQLADPSLVEVLSPGMSVTLVLTETSEIVASHARITALSAPDGGGTFQLGSSHRPLILLDVAAESAPIVSALGQSGQLSVVIET
ncbi:MAG: flagella basal body P-ring formation protein FlgA [Propionibacteriaceae bacterium]|nr:flagella basal body P-ring formation protein FlgA [Propionibacteriaceae bacterium]